MRSKLYLLTVPALLVILLASLAVAQSITVKPDPPKADDATRIGLVTPRVNLLGGGGSVAQETASLRQSISSFLTGPRIGTIDLRAKLDTLALEEGKERACDYVLYISVIRKRQPPARGSVTTSGSGTKAGDEITFEYKLVATDGKQAPVEKTLKATATADGEDVITPMIESTAQAVVSLARVAKPAPATATAAAKPSPEPVATPLASQVQSGRQTGPTGYGSLSATPKRSTSQTVNDPPKAAGTIRIGIATPRLNFVGGGMGGNSEAASLRETLNSYLVGSTLETIDLKARLDSLVITEGQKRECDFVLYTTLYRKRSSSSSSRQGPLNSIIGNGVGTKVPGSKKAQEIATEASKVSGTIATLTRANDEISFEYKLVTSVGARLIAGKVTKAKVKSDGKDVLTPMIESAAQDIVNATVKN